MGGIGHAHIGVDFIAGMGKEAVKHLFRPLKTQICPPQHQQRGNRPRREIGQQHGHRQQQDQFVKERAARDFPNDRQFPRRGETLHIFRGNGCVINHHARGFSARFGGGCGNIIHAGCCHFGNGCHIIQQRQ